MKAILAGALETGLGTVYSNATVFVENGRITGVAEGLDPKNADEVIDASEMIVTPGFIDAHTHIGTYCEGFPEEMADANDMVNPVAPHLRILDAVYQDDTAFADALAGGVTCVQTLPGSGNIIGGQGAVIKTSTSIQGRKKTVDEMIVRAPSCMKAALGENPIRVYKEKQKLPNTRMGNAALLRQALVEASNYRNKTIHARSKNAPRAGRGSLPLYPRPPLRRYRYSSPHSGGIFRSFHSGALHRGAPHRPLSRGKKCLRRCRTHAYRKTEDRTQKQDLGYSGAPLEGRSPFLYHHRPSSGPHRTPFRLSLPGSSGRASPGGSHKGGDDLRRRAPGDRRPGRIHRNGKRCRHRHLGRRPARCKKQGGPHDNRRRDGFLQDLTNMRPGRQFVPFP